MVRGANERDPTVKTIGEKIPKEKPTLAFKIKIIGEKIKEKNPPWL